MFDMAPDPEWNGVLASSEEDGAFNDLQDRLDREDEHGPVKTWPPAGQSPAQLPTRAGLLPDAGRANATGGAPRERESSTQALAPAAGWPKA